MKHAAEIDELVRRGGLNEDQRFVLEVIDGLDHPVLSFIFFVRLRAYQVAYLLDFSRFRIALKARRIGFTEADSLDTVLTSSGFWGWLGKVVNAARAETGAPPIAFPVPHNTNVISKRDKEAKDYVRRCVRWCDALSVPCPDFEGDAQFRRFFVLSRRNDTFIRFEDSDWLVQSDTQSKGAGRGQEGHLKKDEAAHYVYALEIVGSADPVPASNPDLRTSVFSTPNGEEGAGEVFWRKYTDTQTFAHYSRHRVDIYRAIEDGFPITVDEARAICAAAGGGEELFLQEFCCEFEGTGESYFTRATYIAARGTMPMGGRVRRIVGIDVASEVDLTAIVALDQFPDDVWFNHVFLIQGVPYATGARLGQEDIVAAVLWWLNPDWGIIDASADGAELYGRLLSKGVPPLVPHSFHSNGREWKAKHVPRVRTGLESGRLRVNAKPVKVYRPGRAEAVDRSSVEEFMSVAFQETGFDALQNDLMGVKRKLLQSGVTFESPRTKNGHGDSFWAGCMAYSLVSDAQPSFEDVLNVVNQEAPANTRLGPEELLGAPRRKRPDLASSQPSFMDYL